MSNMRNWVSGVAPIDENTIQWASEEGKRLAKQLNLGYRRNENLTTSSLRRFFGEVRRLENLKFEDAQEDIFLLRAKLAYDAGRKEAVKEFYKTVKGGLEVAANDSDSFKRFTKLIEAIVAFHKFHGGKD